MSIFVAEDSIIDPMRRALYSRSTGHDVMVNKVPEDLSCALLNLQRLRRMWHFHSEHLFRMTFKV